MGKKKRQAGNEGSEVLCWGKGLMVAVIRICNLKKLEVGEGAGQAGIWGNAFYTEKSAPITPEWEGSLACWCAGGRSSTCPMGMEMGEKGESKRRGLRAKRV